MPAAVDPSGREPGACVGRRALLHLDKGGGGDPKDCPGDAQTLGSPRELAKTAPWVLINNLLFNQHPR